jgi:branched-chain amino acid transport system substrate-binding protein
MFRRILLSALLSIVATNWGFAQVAVKVGVLNDQSGVYADVGGKGSVIAAQLAVEDFKAAGNGLQVEVVSADHQNKPDIGAEVCAEVGDGVRG